MAITGKTRKILWARSGNRCALCRRELVMPETATNDAAVIGDECHIASAKPNGPRSSKKLPQDEYDKPANLLLLCRVHHKQVDDQDNAFTVERLTSIKAQHEQWVRDSLAPQTEKQHWPVEFLTRITTGKELMSMNSGCCAYLFDHDEPENETEMEAISAFHQNAQEWGEIWDDIEAGGRVEAQFGLTKQITELEEIGFWVFGMRQVRKVNVMRQSPTWPVFVMTVVRKTNPGITPLGDLASIVKEA